MLVLLCGCREQAERTECISDSAELILMPITLVRSGADGELRVKEIDCPVTSTNLMPVLVDMLGKTYEQKKGFALNLDVQISVEGYCECWELNIVRKLIEEAHSKPIVLIPTPRKQNTNIQYVTSFRSEGMTYPTYMNLHQKWKLILQEAEIERQFKSIGPIPTYSEKENLSSERSSVICYVARGGIYCNNELKSVNQFFEDFKPISKNKPDIDDDDDEDDDDDDEDDGIALKILVLPDTPYNLYVDVLLHLIDAPFRYTVRQSHCNVLDWYRDELLTLDDYITKRKKEVERHILQAKGLPVK